MPKAKRINTAQVTKNIELDIHRRHRANTKLIAKWEDSNQLDDREHDFLLDIRYIKSVYLSDKQLAWEYSIHNRILHSWNT